MLVAHRIKHVFFLHVVLLHHDQQRLRISRVVVGIFGDERRLRRVERAQRRFDAPACGGDVGAGAFHHGFGLPHVELAGKPGLVERAGERQRAFGAGDRIQPDAGEGTGASGRV
mgnify:CR=1 FL=1